VTTSKNETKKLKTKIYSLLVICGLLFIGFLTLFIPAFGGGFSFPVITFSNPLEGLISKTNFLIIGQDYGINTDTILIGKLSHTDNKFTLTSLPRDLLIKDKTGDIYKINSIWHKQGLEYLNQFLGNELGIKIDYRVKINIDGLAKVIDSLGGIAIEVENAFTDCEYPNQDFSGLLRPCPHFDSGSQNMDSTRALIYARSRKSYDNPSEAIDFARSKRQNKVIEAVIKKIKNSTPSPSLISNLYSGLSNNLETNLDIISTTRLIQIVTDKDFEQVVAKQNLDFQSEIVCGDEDGSSDIVFCDKSILGDGKYSKDKERLKELVN
jgi:polyisoprenyl-teichoic acid--peptidoglycan teichoic acid transferase